MCAPSAVGPPRLRLAALIALIGLQPAGGVRSALDDVSAGPALTAQAEVSNSFADVDGVMTIGFEQEWSYATFDKKDKVTSEGVTFWMPSRALADHTRVAHTKGLDVSFETQGSGESRRKGHIEIISRVFALSNASGKAQLERALSQAQALQEVFESATPGGWFELEDVVSAYNKERGSEEMTEGLDDLQVYIPPKSKLKRLPQITVTHSLRTVHSLFSRGWPIEAGRMSRHADVPFRTAMMTGSAEAADGIFKRLFSKSAKGLGEDGLASIKGFLTLQAQVMLVTSLKVQRKRKGRSCSDAVTPNNCKGIAVFPGTKKPFNRNNQWFKDYFGLTMKTPLGAVFRYGLGAAEQDLLLSKLAGVKKELRSILTDALKRRGFRTLHGKLDVGCASSEIFIDTGSCYLQEDIPEEDQLTVDEYHELTMASPKAPPPKGGAPLSDRIDKAFGEALGNGTAKPIRHEEGARPAFEYRQLGGAGPGDHLTALVNSIIGSAARAAKPLRG